MKKDSFNDFVQTVLDEFCVFINDEVPLSHLSIVFDIDSPDCGRYEETPNGHLITINQRGAEQYTDRGKGVVFHELTHFYDHATLLPHLSVEERKSLLLHYTEFHASYVQMQCWCGFCNANEIRRISILDRIPQIANEISIGDFYMKEVEIARKLASLYCTSKIENPVVRHMKRAMYYAGEIWFAKKSADFDIDLFFDITAFSLYLGNRVEDLIRLFMTDEPISESLLRKSLALNPYITGFAACVHNARKKHNTQ